ncbi:uncharacterized protein BX663DRAFT_506728 [Cokeromyces recurvatus]|uniref:uncharacterized protein n=1 Tax=Cokeromyces recurvatus TaxID=90255 RepID=UPI00221FDB58|nr:uncharacterized protein BX663DRAFT_506728 [Cokeromyces recurvatus]KAI7903517.1 hypothetical protein BX663DRAFT_506728 [Cokeromyces recurvatus]
MGLIDKIKNSYDYYKVDKYTKRRTSQSQFESHDRRYYENVYRDGDYLNPEDVMNNNASKNTTHLAYRNSRWSFPELLRKSSKKQLPAVVASQLKNSENYTLGRAA